MLRPSRDERIPKCLSEIWPFDHSVRRTCNWVTCITFYITCYLLLLAATCHYPLLSATTCYCLLLPATTYYQTRATTCHCLSLPGTTWYYLHLPAPATAWRYLVPATPCYYLGLPDAYLVFPGTQDGSGRPRACLISGPLHSSWRSEAGHPWHSPPTFAKISRKLQNLIGPMTEGPKTNAGAARRTNNVV
jgi:hypothetical protein